jgi:phage repressor protein C with HTH and peptisase S24 domain
MRPVLEAGDWLLVQYAGRPVPGDIVVARFADGALVVKRATERRRTATGDAGWWLLSDDPGVGVDSRHRGPVREADVVAVGRVRLWPRPRRLG